MQSRKAQRVVRLCPTCGQAAWEPACSLSLSLPLSLSLSLGRFPVPEAVVYRRPSRRVRLTATAGSVYECVHETV